MSAHVIVETNWVVAFAAPVLTRSPDASALLARAAGGALTLHIPAVALVEARKVIRERSVGRDVDVLRAFVRIARDDDRLAPLEANAAFKALDQFEQAVRAERANAASRISQLATERGVNVFALDESMLERSTMLAGRDGVGLQSFDLAIAAGVMVLSERLTSEGHEVAFCTLDGDRQPWDRNGQLRRPLADFYDAAGVWVFGDFLLANPPRPTGWGPIGSST